MLSREAAVGLLAEAARRPELATTDAARQLVADRVVASQVEVALAGHPDMRRYRIDVECARGVVTLELPARRGPRRGARGGQERRGECRTSS